MQTIRKQVRAVAATSAPAFMLVETLVGVALGVLMLSSLYACFVYGWAIVQATREDLRATQILLQRMERVRLCTFEQITDPTCNPRTTSEVYDPKNQSAGTGGVVYTITFDASAPPAGSVPESYRLNMLVVTVRAAWNSGKVAHQCSMQTYVARKGMEGYVSRGM